MFKVTPLFGSIRGTKNLLYMRRVMMRFWSPFSRGHVGPDLDTYGFKEVFDSMRTNDSDFTCQVNGQVGDARLIEDFFHVILCGFDVVNVELKKIGAADASVDPFNFEGIYTLAHTRPFLGWRPPTASNRLPSTAAAGGDGDAPGPKAPAAAAAPVFRGVERGAPLLKVPFSARLEGCERIISHMTFRTTALEVICGHHDCPVAVRSCLQNVEALRALVALRRAKVRADIITDKTLLGMTNRKDLWSSALGIL